MTTAPHKRRKFRNAKALRTPMVPLVIQKEKFDEEEVSHKEQPLRIASEAEDGWLDDDDDQDEEDDFEEFVDSDTNDSSKLHETLIFDMQLSDGTDDTNNDDASSASRTTSTDGQHSYDTFTSGSNESIINNKLSRSDRCTPMMNVSKGMKPSEEDTKTPYEQALEAIELLRSYELEQHRDQKEETDNNVMPTPLDFDDALLHSDDSNIVWNYDAENRLLRADCSTVEELSIADVAKLAYLMERDDLILITKGLFMQIDDIDSFLAYIGSNQSLYHKFRRFVRNVDTNEFAEVSGYVEMTPADYVEYLQSLHDYINDNGTSEDEEDAEPAIVRYKIHGTEEQSPLQDIRLYMVDVDISTLYRQLDRSYQESCKWNSILPGGNLCMMGEMPKQMQPFMGPNLYITPGATYTNLHQDGFGSVDSGHSNLYGTNEVIMLRRLPELHKQRASQMLNVDVLYRMPHDDDTTTQHSWPTHSVIEQWKALKYVLRIYQSPHFSQCLQLLSSPVSAIGGRTCAHQ